jgi:protein TonB
MNILNYKWSALAAASLHGAFFVCFPNSPTVSHPAKPPVIEVSQPLPMDDFVPPKSDVSSEDTPPTKVSGGPVLPEIPDEMPPPTKTQMPNPIPTIERTTIGPVAVDLKHFIGGPDGPGTGVGIGPGSIVPIHELDNIPRATVQPSPQYPENMQRSGTTGSVTVEFDVDASGRVYRAEAVHSTNRSFDEPAVRAVLKWRFEPGRRHGRAVPFRMAVPVEFGKEAV